ncbi:MAG TPA: hypothetical protein VGC62_14095 [Pseudomonas sp.]|uniref:hypothetical protein n=1 Tax=Pseudomonas sp. TaxID=306 RepID=UPI002EDB9DD5
MSTYEVHSQASNFLGFVKTGVDPRTGQFTLAMSLATVPANNLAGPTLTPTLAFSTLGSTQNHGFGFGWSLNLSELNLNPNGPTLRLTSGEQFAVDWESTDLSVGGKLTLLDYKLRSLVVTRLTDDSFRVDLKSGESEILKLQDSGNYLLTERRTVEGRCLFIDWLPIDNGHSIIEKIRDETRTLLRIVRENEEIHFINNPDSDLGSTTIRLLLSNGQLSSVYLPEIERPFSFSYETYPVGPDAQLLLPVELSGPMGAWDTVLWATGDDGHLMPAGAPFPYLPRVAGWTHCAGGHGCELYRTYQWIGEHNFLGFGSDQSFNWQQGRDNLYQVERDYNYEVIETQRDNNDKLLATITRTWNRFHLQTQEVSRQGPCEARVDTLYGVDPHLTWEQQPAWCQLPHKTVTTYIDHSRINAHRSEQTLYRYDDYANVLYIRYPTGVEEHSEYYPAQGAEGCPPDALGMVRYLKQNTVIPARGPDGVENEAAVISINYTYQTLDSLLEDGLSHAVVVSEQVRDTTHDRVLETTRQSYVKTRNAHYGRDAGSINTLNGRATSTSYHYEINDNGLKTEITVHGFENDAENRDISSSTQSLLTGLTILEQSSTGMQTRYEHDALDRVVRTVVAQGSAYEAANTTRYHIEDAFAYQNRADDQINPVLIEQTDVTGQRKRSWLDGAGRTVRVELEDLDHAPGVFHEIARTVYDAQGRPVNQRVQDWLPNNPHPLVRNTLTRHDDWGNVSSVEAPDGVISHSRHDPILRRNEQWQQSTNKRGPRRVTLTNVAGSPIEHQLFDEDDRLVRTTQLIRDGLDRVIEERIKVDGQPNIVTRSRFDAYSRVIERQLPDGTTVTWRYAPHSDADHPESITVTPAKEANV